jgi:hypothetical protein
MMPTWKSKWPATPNLGSWFRCGIEKCLAIEDVSKGAAEAHLPIRALADLGLVKESLKHVNRYFQLLPPTESLERVRMAELGATICLRANDMAGCDKYLEVMAGVDKTVTRKCYKGVGTRYVHEFKVFHGLLDPNDAKNDGERIVARYNAALRQLREALSRRDRKAARRLILEMNACTPHAERWQKAQWLKEVIKYAAELDDTTLVKQLIESVPKKSRQELLGFSLYATLGMKKEAIDGAVQEIKSRLHELQEMEDPNIHFPIHGITRALQCLIDLGEKQLASQWFRKVAASAKKWKCVIRGWTTTSVLTSFVPIVEILEGPEAAHALAQQAQQHAASETKRGFRRGAMSAACAAEAKLSPIDDAITKARQLRSPTGRRMELAKLLAKAERWKELKEVCCEVSSPEEAAKIAWWVKFELPGGAAT